MHALFTKAVGSAADIKRAVTASRHEISLDCEHIQEPPNVQTRTIEYQTAISIERVQPQIPQTPVHAVAAK